MFTYPVLFDFANFANSGTQEGNKNISVNVDGYLKVSKEVSSSQEAIQAESILTFFLVF